MKNKVKTAVDTFTVVQCKDGIKWCSDRRGNMPPFQEVCDSPLAAAEAWLNLRYWGHGQNYEIISVTETSLQVTIFRILERVTQTNGIDDLAYHIFNSFELLVVNESKLPSKI